MKIHINKKYTYRNGEPARILCTDSMGKHPVLSEDSKGCVYHHLSNGEWCNSGGPNAHDLIEIPEAREPREWRGITYANGIVALMGNSNDFPIAGLNVSVRENLPDEAERAKESAESMHDTPNVHSETRYRELGPDEVIQEGDEVNHGKGWFPAIDSPTLKVSDARESWGNPYFRARRLVTGPEGDDPIESFINGLRGYVLSGGADGRHLETIKAAIEALTGRAKG